MDNKIYETVNFFNFSLILRPDQDTLIKLLTVDNDE